MEPRIRYVKTADSASVAFWTLGERWTLAGVSQWSASDREHLSYRKWQR
jgi:hypothetical protein